MSSQQEVTEKSFTRCSDSEMWSIMMNFYDAQGIRSWSKGIVPSFVTQNAFIGRSYARVIAGYIIDLYQNKNRFDPAEKLYLIELGAGTGKLAFYILKSLDEIKNRLNIHFPVDQIVYVLTDFTESNVIFWEEHEALKPFVQQGRLDFAKFEAENDDSLSLRVSGNILTKGTVKNPLVIIGNYLVDTLSQDIFQIDKGVLKEGLVSVQAKEQGSDNGSMNHSTENTRCSISIQNEYKYQAIIDEQIDSYYKEYVLPCDEMHLTHILHWYKKYFSSEANAKTTCCHKTPDSASLLIPIGFIKALRALTDLSCGRALIITGDKGASDPNRFRGLTDPHMAFHGSFSVMANFHAIKLYCMSRGGFALMSDQDEVSLMVNAFVLTGDGNEAISCPPSSLPAPAATPLDVNSSQAPAYQNLCNAFEDQVNSFSPNDFYLMQRCMVEEARNPSLSSILSLFKLSNWDCELFFKLRENVISQIPRATIGMKSDFEAGSKKIWSNYYHLDNDKDVAFELGRVMFGLHCWEESLKFYQLSVDICGQHHITQHNMGLCYASLNKYHEATACFVRSLEFKPDYEKAATWLEQIKNKEIASLTKL
jgi:tetratricopeptide (TPR) repeat protein